MSFASWREFYYADWQWPWALLVVPFAFAVYRLIAGPRARGGDADAQFLTAWTWLFLLETMLDPIATGPIAKAFGSEAASTALGLGFVLLGDLRIWWLVFALAAPGDARRAFGIALVPTAAVPIAAWLANYLLGSAIAELPGQVLWWIHESLFVATAGFVAWRWLPARTRDDGRVALLRGVLGYAAAYYALWAAADALILVGVDAGWLLRCVPNQLYYALSVPFVWQRFHAQPLR